MQSNFNKFGFDHIHYKDESIPQVCMLEMGQVGWCCCQVAGLECLTRMLCMEVIELRSERERALASRTLAGHAKNFLGYCLSFYCLFRRGPCP